MQYLFPSSMKRIAVVWLIINYMMIAISLTQDINLRGDTLYEIQIRNLKIKRRKMSLLVVMMVFMITIFLSCDLYDHNKTIIFLTKGTSIYK